MQEIKFGVEEVRQILEGLFLLHHHSNVERLESLGENLGYPVLLLTMSAIQFVASLCSDKDSNLDPLDAYFDRFMKRVDPRYGIRFFPNLKRIEKKGEKRSLQESNRKYTNVGTILREAMRNRLTHSCGTLLEIDARKSMEHLHLAIRKTNQGSHCLFVHAYRLYHDYRESLKHLYNDLVEEEDLAITIRNNLGCEWADIMLMRKAVNEVIEQHLRDSCSEPSREKLTNFESIFSRLQQLGRTHFDDPEGE